MLNKIIISALMFFPLLSVADSYKDYIPEYKSWLVVSNYTKVDVKMLYAVALMESGKTTGESGFIPNAFALGVGVDHDVNQYYHDSFFPKDYDEGLFYLNAYLNDGHKNLGVGMFQVNLKYHSDKIESPSELLDPIRNMEVAAEILSWCSKRVQDIRKILSCYSDGRFESEKGFEYADKAITYMNEYGEKFVQDGIKKAVKNKQFASIDYEDYVLAARKINSKKNVSDRKTIVIVD